MHLPAPIQDLIDAFSYLPGIGPKTASRLTFYLLQAPEDLSQNLASALQGIKSGTEYCPNCFNIMEAGRETCLVCSSSDRVKEQICVVESALDVISIERSGGYRGIYHVLHGAINPIEGVGPDDIRIKELMGRIRGPEINEVIIATNPNIEGEATAMLLLRRLRERFPELRVTRIARGLPSGGDLEYADQNTLLRALAGRQVME